jgi:hypothetical protein
MSAEIGTVCYYIFSSGLVGENGATGGVHPRPVWNTT